MAFIRQETKNKVRAVQFKGTRLFDSSSTFLLFAISLVVLIFIIGCPLVEPAPVAGPGTEPKQQEPNEIGPNEFEPNEVEPSEPNKAEPDKVEPNEAKIPSEVSFHRKCAAVLGNFVDDKGMVGYRRLNLKRLELRTVLDEFAKLDPNEYNSWPKEDKIALWINAWNIQMLRIIIENYPIEASAIFKLVWPPDSIRHIPPTGVIGALKWNEYKFFVMGEQFTLAEIERRFFREKFDEPRVFFAITQASLSGPPLRNEPYYGYKLYEQLDDQAKKFLSGFRAFGIDRKKKRVYLSALLDPNWYGTEFISKYGTDKRFKDHPPATRAALNFVVKYISKQDASFLERQNYSVKFIGYDWRLNNSSGNK